MGRADDEDALKARHVRRRRADDGLARAPISPTTVVPRWALRAQAAPLMASACAPRGLRSSLGSLPPFSEGR